jgi:hypothetical protein
MLDVRCSYFLLLKGGSGPFESQSRGVPARTGAARPGSVFKNEIDPPPKRLSIRRTGDLKNRIIHAAPVTMPAGVFA